MICPELTSFLFPLLLFLPLLYVLVSFGNTHKSSWINSQANIFSECFLVLE